MATTNGSKHSKGSFGSSHLKDLHCYTETEGVITTTTYDIPGYKVVEPLGTVYGITVRSRNFFVRFVMGLKSIAGGELNWFTSMLYSARNDAISRLVAEAKGRGGNAIICLRFESGEVGNGFAQSCAYGTAAIVEKIGFEPATDVQPLPT